MADDRFGNIKIAPDSPEGSQGQDVPLSRQGEVEEKSPPLQVDAPLLQPEEKIYKPRRRQRANYGLSLPSRRTAAWFSVLPLLFVLYAVGSYFLVPSVISSILLPNLSRQIDRQIEVGRIVFSPFALELLVDNLTVGPVQGDRTGKVLLVLKNARFQFSLRQILEGKPVLMQAVLDGVSVNVVRDQEDMTAELRMISDLFLSIPADQDVFFWPAWFFLDEVKVADGRITIDDLQANKIFSVEDLQFFLPSAATRERDKSALPKLRAVIDSSPFEVNAVRFRNQSGAWRTGFSFEFKKLIIGNFKELLPLPETGLRLSDGEMDVKLDIILPDDKHGPDSVVVEGEAHLGAVRWHDPDAQTVLALPEGRIVFHLVPADKLVRLSNVEFHGPELTLAGKKDTATRETLSSVAYLANVLAKMSRGEEVLEVENFLCDNGRVILTSGGAAGDKTELNDVTLGLSRFTTAGHRRSHPNADDTSAYTFRAKDLDGKQSTSFNSEGKFNLKGALSGKVEITGLNMARYPSLLPKSSFGLSKGKADIVFQYEYGSFSAHGQGRPASQDRIYNGSIKTTGYVLTKNGNKAAAGEFIKCSGFYLDTPLRTLVCDQLELGKSDIFTEIILGHGEGKEKDGADNWRYSIINLLVNGSSIHIPLKGSTSAEKTSLVAQDVSIEGKSLLAEKVTDNVKASARIDKKGSLTLSGSYSKHTGLGNMQLDIREMGLSLLQPYFSSWFVPKLGSGTLSAIGTLQLPGGKFKGKIQVDDLDAGEGSGARISWKKAFANECIYRPDPLLFVMDELIVQQPALDPGLSSGGLPVDKYLRLSDYTLPQSVHIGRIRFEDGNFSLSEPIIYPGYQPQLQSISGTLSPGNAKNLDFAIKGKMNNRSSFTLMGKSSLSRILSYQLDVDDFPLLPFDPILKKEAGFSGLQTVASLRQEMVREEQSSKVGTNIIVRDVTPDLAGSASQMLPLIINEDLLFAMRLDDNYTDDKQQPFLLELLINRLHHLEVKAAISPHLVLKSTLPAVDLLESITFAPGSSNLELSQSLAGYKELLRMRPFIALGLQGQYDAVLDRNALQAELQKEADRQREIENKRRALEKVKLLQLEKKRLKELEAKGPGVVTEEIVPADETEDLQSLPPVTVQVDPSRIKKLAEQRAQIVHDYLLNKLQLDPKRVKLESSFAEGTTGVRIHILPYMPPDAGRKSSDF